MKRILFLLLGSVATIFAQVSSVQVLPDGTVIGPSVVNFVTGTSQLQVNGVPVGAGGSGTVTSLTATAPVIVTPSPITNIGVISITPGAFEVPLTFSQSLARAVTTVTLTGDTATPGNSKYYGTDSGGTKGWFALPAGGSGTVTSITATAPIVVTPTPLIATGVISVTGAALTKTDDTNVTLTLGGTPATSLLAATSITAGWTGTLAVARGGTGAATAGANTVFGNNTASTAAPVFSSSPRFTAIGNLTTDGFVKTSGAVGTLGVDTTAYTPTSRTLTIAGTANDLSANRTWTQDNITGLASTGMIKRTGVNTLAIAAAGTDYEAALGNPGTNGFVLSSTTTGTRSWIASGGGGGTPGGSDTYVQFNDASAFGGSSTFAWNKATNILNVNGITLETAGILRLPTTAASAFYFGGSGNGIGYANAGGAWQGDSSTGDLVLMVGGSKRGLFATALTQSVGFYTGSTFGLCSGTVFGFASGNATTAIDTGFYRNAAGVVEVNNGTAGTYRDILGRGLRSNAVTFANAIAAPVEGTFQAFTDSTTNVNAATITGGGTNHVQGYYNGTNWVVSSGTGSGGAPGGSTTQVQYNNAGALGGITSQTTNGTIVTQLAGTNFVLADPTTNTKKAQFDLSNITAANTRTVNIPDVNSTTIQADTGATNNFLTAVSAQGAISKAQPAFTNLSGTASSLQRGEWVNASTAAGGQAVGTADTYIAGSNVVVGAGNWAAGGQYKCRFEITKTAASTATWALNIRVGTAGTTADTAIIGGNVLTQTAAIDTMMVDVNVNIRTIGASATSAANILYTHSAASSAGYGLTAAVIPAASAQIATFNSTTATTIGVSFNGGASHSGTVTTVQASYMQ